MFSDFDEKQQQNEGRGRMGASLGVSLLVFGGLALLLGSLAATAHGIIAKKKDTPIEFASLPPAPAPIKKVQPKPQPKTKQKRKKAKRKAIGAPKEIPEEIPEEAEGDLADAGETGAVDGYLDGVDDTNAVGNGLPPMVMAEAPARRPTSVRETVTAPVFLSGCSSIVVPPEVKNIAETIRIDVRIVVGPDGKPAKVTMVRSHPLIPDELVLECARQQLFEPAKLAGIGPVPYPYPRRFVFRPSNL